MMKIENLGSKESVGVKFKYVKWAELCLRLWLKATYIFVMSLSQDDFESNSLETKFQRIFS